jgi:hypothetical protein
MKHLFACEIKRAFCLFDGYSLYGRRFYRLEYFSQAGDLDHLLFCYIISGMILSRYQKGLAKAFPSNIT